jgi:hypothetical protein
MYNASYNTPAASSMRSIYYNLASMRLNDNPSRTVQSSYEDDEENQRPNKMSGNPKHEASRLYLMIPKRQLANTTKRERESTTWRDKALDDLTAAKNDLQQLIQNMHNNDEWVDIQPAWKAVQELTDELTEAETTLVTRSEDTSNMASRCRAFQETMENAPSSSSYSASYHQTELQSIRQAVASSSSHFPMSTPHPDSKRRAQLHRVPTKFDSSSSSSHFDRTQPRKEPALLF